MHEILQTGLTLLGGLAIFLYGMNTMSGSLQKAAGDRMHSTLGANIGTTITAHIIAFRLSDYVLAIVKHAVAYHEGTIDVSSEEGTGTEFVVRLPRHAGDSQQLPTS